MLIGHVQDVCYGYSETKLEDFSDWSTKIGVLSIKSYKKGMSLGKQ